MKDCTVQATEAVEGDVAENLALLLPQINKVDARPDWFGQINKWKELLPFAYEKETPDGLIKPQTLIAKLSALTQKLNPDGKTIITTGVGQHQMWTAQHFQWRQPRTMITSGGLGTMGFGLPGSSSTKSNCYYSSNSLCDFSCHRSQSSMPRRSCNRHRRRRFL